MRGLISLSLLGLLACGCASRFRSVAVSEPVLRPGDCLIIQFTNLQAPEIRQLIDPNGDIALRWVGTFHVAGLTLPQAGEAIGAAYIPRWHERVMVEVSKCL